VRPYVGKKPSQNIGRMEWVKVYALSSNPSIVGEKKSNKLEPGAKDLKMRKRFKVRTRVSHIQQAKVSLRYDRVPPQIRVKPKNRYAEKGLKSEQMWQEKKSISTLLFIE
jgi:hypothetical protein